MYQLSKIASLIEKVEKWTFVGYNSISKGYRIYNIEFGKFFISIDVNVDEDSYCDLNISEVRRMDVEPVSKDSNEDLEAENDDHFLIRVTRPLVEIYGKM